MPQKTKNGKWKVDLRPNGSRGKRIIRTFPSHAEATRFEAYVIAQAVSQKPWAPRQKDRRRLSELVELWFQLHGTLLSNGIRQLAILNNLVSALNDPIAADITHADFMRYRASTNLAPKTLNNQLGYINSVYNKLYRAKIIDYKSPLQEVETIKYERRELQFLTEPQIDELLAAAAQDYNPDVYPCALLCLETGSRWGEAEGLRRDMVRKHERGFSVTFVDTKGKRARTVPIRREVYELLRNHNAPSQKIFNRCIRQFNRVAASLSFKLPERQNTHILRHTFASHFVMNGGNILVLQKILGHVDIKDTMRYSHLAPEHLDSAIRFGPMAGKNLENKPLTKLVIG